LLGRVAAAAGIRAREAVVLPKDLPTMTECFLLSSTKDVTPVGSIDDLRYNVGTDTVSARLKAAFAGYARESAAMHPELKV
jgi:branched-chain amino acid aminotransferase